MHCNDLEDIYKSYKTQQKTFPLISVVCRPAQECSERHQRYDRHLVALLAFSSTFAHLSNKEVTNCPLVTFKSDLNSREVYTTV